ncbi:hypothetical protein BU25DRAFT_176848 [Macroventuria anomochaeta]|uniref:Uncharacterized protein n=1 Tax=Macroventuria anomochaeta TaxID=301207 RepID=A0ACB6RNV9_9PLEO|nr:uncharacterized protein BU25DRAFT_176848 [Macroventuria anomochaeta]KAF2623576.1 hypothetical protein BU25DRAFT_176848 [Macroventuria anomochaeta]
MKHGLLAGSSFTSRSLSLTTAPFLWWSWSLVIPFFDGIPPCSPVSTWITFCFVWWTLLDLRWWEVRNLETHESRNNQHALRN